MRDSNKVKVIRSSFTLVEDQGSPSNQLQVEAQGHPSQALERSHEIAKLMFEGEAWRYTHISYMPPTPDQLASEGILSVTISARTL